MAAMFDDIRRAAHGDVAIRGHHWKARLERTPQLPERGGDWRWIQRCTAGT